MTDEGSMIGRAFLLGCRAAKQTAGRAEYLRGLRRAMELLPDPCEKETVYAEPPAIRGEYREGWNDCLGVMRGVLHREIEEKEWADD